MRYLPLALLALAACAPKSPYPDWFAPPEGAPRISDETRLRFNCEWASLTYEWKNNRGQLPAPGASPCVAIGRLGEPSDVVNTRAPGLWMATLFWRRSTPVYVSARLDESKKVPDRLGRLTSVWEITAITH